MTLIEDMKKSSSKKSSKDSYVPRCYETHPAYPVTEQHVIYGGACSWPVVSDADVYGGFDSSMHPKAGVYPWSDKTGPVEFLFRIVDGSVPDDVNEFSKMIDWLSEQLLAGKKVHIGCIGGHGRTGLVLAALRKHMTGDEDAITHVRKNYCKKAVESQKQIDWLNKHFGIKKEGVAPSKTWGGTQGSFSHGSSSQKYHSYGQTTAGKHETTGNPLNMASSIWGDDG
jgi:hypothetical protein